MQPAMSRRLVDARVLGLIAGCYQADGDPPKWSLALADIRERFDAKIACLGTFDLCRRSGELVHAAGVDDTHLRSYREQYSGCDAAFAGERLLPSSDAAWRDSDIVDPVALADTRFVREWLLPQGVSHVARAVLQRRDSTIVFFALGRTAEAGAYAPDELDLLGHLVPHMRRSLEIGRETAALRAAADVVEEVLNRLPEAVLVLDSSGAIVRANRSAEALLQENDALRRADGRLVVAGLDEQRRLRELVQAATAPADPCFFGTLQVRRGERRPLHVSVSSVRLRRSADGGETYVMLIVVDPDRDPPIDLRELQRSHGLTLSEARLAAQMAKGERLRAAAATLGVSYGTARTHLKHVFSKTGTSRQAELVRLVLARPSVAP